MTDRRHVRWMQTALDLARRGEGRTRPNPPVGAVIVKRGRVLGQGWHQRAGGAHAEAAALARVKGNPRGAVMYVTLEPCSTTGRTPPCVAAIIAAGIRQVVVAVRDPNPRHAGRGLALLRRAGIEVMEGVCRDAALALITPFTKWILTGRPYLTLKMAASLDGRTADYRRRSRWITGPAARCEVQAMRRRADVVMVGSGTVLADDPSLLPRPDGGRLPWRVLLDSRGRIPARARALRDAAAPRTIMATTRLCPPAVQKAWRARGAQIWVLPSAGGRVSLPALLRRLGRAGMLHVLCEGGSELSAELARRRMVDEYVWFFAPCLIGGARAPGILGGAGRPLRHAPRLRIAEYRLTGNDLMVRAFPVDKPL